MAFKLWFLLVFLNSITASDYVLRNPNDPDAPIMLVRYRIPGYQRILIPLNPSWNPQPDPNLENSPGKFL